jgi:uncharacterized protein (TIGR02466 family)
MIEAVDLFPSTVGLITLDEDVSDYEMKVKNLGMQPSVMVGNKNSFVTSSKTIFDNLPELGKIVQRNFDIFKNTILHLNSTEFEITTSWGTMTQQDGYCQFHNHKNCYYSCVLYFNDCEQGGQLVFDDFGLKMNNMLLNAPSKSSIRTAKTYSIQPKKNLMVVFPSELRHRINLYTGEEDRISVAFNLMPVGKVGSGDSTMWTKQHRN